MGADVWFVLAYYKKFSLYVVQGFAVVGKVIFLEELTTGQLHEFVADHLMSLFSQPAIRLHLIKLLFNAGSRIVFIMFTAGAFVERFSSLLL